MEFAVGAFKWFLNAADIFDDLQLFDHINVNMHRITDQSEDGLLGTLTLMHLNILGFDPAFECCKLALISVVFQNNNHFLLSYVKIF